MVDVYRLGLMAKPWDHLPDPEARFFLECIRRAYAIGDDAAPFRLMRGDLTYHISRVRFGSLKKKLLKRHLISRHPASSGAFLRDYFKLEASLWAQ